MSIVGRYTVLEEFATGGMASVHLGLMRGDAGFSRIVAIKRLHRQFASDPAFVGMLVDEARVSQRVRHPNVAQLLDVVQDTSDLLLVMEYIHGENFAKLCSSGQPPSWPVVSAVMQQMLQGLGAAHEATTSAGQPLHLVHRDVSPQNVLVGADGHARVLDFGIAHAQGRLETTKEGHLKGKIPYMAPEQLRNDPATPLFDLYASGVVLWEALVGRRLYRASSEAALVLQIMSGPAPRARSVRPELPQEVDALLAKALSPDPSGRFQTATLFSQALQQVIPAAPTREVQDWVRLAGGAALASQSQRIRELEMAGPGEPPLAQSREDVSGHFSQGSLRLGVSSGTRPKPQSNKRWWLALGATGGVLLGAAAAMMGKDQDAPSSAADVVIEITTVNSSAQVDETRAPIEAPASAPSPTVSPSVENSAVEPVKSNVPLRDGRRSARPTASASTTAEPTVNCTNQFVVGPDGVKRFRKECL